VGCSPLTFGNLGPPSVFVCLQFCLARQLTMDSRCMHCWLCSHFRETQRIEKGMGEREVEGRDKRMKKGWGIDIHCRPVDCGPLQFFSGGCAYVINRFLLLLSELKMQKNSPVFSYTTLKSLRQYYCAETRCLLLIVITRFV